APPSPSVTRHSCARPTGSSSRRRAEPLISSGDGATLGPPLERRATEGTLMDYRIISADCHIDMTWMPGDLWVKNAPAKLREQVPHVRETAEGPRWYAEETD